MHYSTLLLPLGAILSLAAAQNSFNIPPGGISFTAGQPKELTWTPSTSGTVTLYVRQGDPKALNKGSIIAKSIPNDGKFTWTPDTSIVKGNDFAIEIVSDADPKQSNFTPQFPVDSTNTVTVANSKTTSYTQPPSSSATGSTTGTATGSSSTGSSSTRATTTASAASATTTGAASTGAAATIGAKAAGALVAALGVMVAL
ncbi:MAG: hypothetical protein M1814_005733 [Vezdaea aestivalis]|nr:MAG: hypothetical protein M1814_005733 [Vezdaea aestivalis]